MGMDNATHSEAVTVLKNTKEVCSLVVSREVLVVMPDESGKCVGRDSICMYLQMSHGIISQCISESSPK